MSERPSLISRPRQGDTTPPVADSARIGNAEQPPKGWRGAISTIVLLIAAPVLALFIINFIFQSYEVDGPSMETTLHDHDRLIVNKLPRTLARITRHDYVPHRGDVIIFIERGLIGFDGNGDKQLIKRVIGLPGERVVYKNGRYKVYNDQFPTGFNPDKGQSWSDVVKPAPGNVDIIVPDGQLFVSGDNRPQSLDSRSEQIGTVPMKDIVGKLAFRIFPLSH